MAALLIMEVYVFSWWSRECSRGPGSSVRAEGCLQLLCRPPSVPLHEDIS